MITKDYKEVQLFHNNVIYKYLQLKNEMIDATVIMNKRYTTRYTRYKKTN